MAALFLKLGLIGFGGPSAHIALMRTEVVGRKRWLGDQQFLDLVGATNLIPGPNSTELAIHIGHARAGWRGLVVAGGCFILPAALIVGVCGWAYVRFGSVPQAQALLYGVKPVVIVIVAHALWALGQAALKSTWLVIVGLASVGATLLGVHELVVLGAAAAVCLFQGSFGAPPRAHPVVAPVAALAAGVAGGTMAAPVGLATLFGVFLKCGALLFGSGYVLLAFLRVDLVERLHWLTEQQLLDAIAVGQVTPGPVFTTATFVGYVLAGSQGAAAATIAIFLPAFVFVALTAPIVPKLRESPAAGAALDGLNAASLALMAVVTWQLAASAIVDPFALVIAAGAAVSMRYRVNSAWAIAGGALAGLIARGGLR